VSEQGWREFLAAEGTQDWVVLHGGATAAFRSGSLIESASLAKVAADVLGTSCEGVLLTIAEKRLTIRLSRDVWQLEPDQIEVARAISAAMRQQGAVPDRAVVQEVQVAIAAKAEMIDVGFWRAVLGYQPMAEDNAVDPLGHGSTVWMQEIDPAKSLRHAMHIDVSVAREHVQARLSAAVAAGGKVVDESHAPSHWTLSDRAGNRVCICAWPDGINQKPIE
jgi:4a-hydroxytetrahydrobiopterin dehydratase